MEAAERSWAGRRGDPSCKMDEGRGWVWCGAAARPGHSYLPPALTIPARHNMRTDWSPESCSYRNMTPCPLFRCSTLFFFKTYRQLQCHYNNSGAVCVSVSTLWTPGPSPWCHGAASTGGWMMEWMHSSFSAAFVFKVLSFPINDSGLMFYSAREQRLHPCGHLWGLITWKIA